MPTPFSELFAAQWPLMLDTHGQVVTLVDADGVTYTVTGVVNPRSDDTAIDVTWEQRARQSELFVSLPVGYVSQPGDCTATVGGVEYVIMDYVASTAGITKLLIEREELESVAHRGRPPTRTRGF
jgi:hypothetical protein